MTKQSLVEPGKFCVIEGVNGAVQFQITLSLGDEYLGGDMVRIVDRERFSVAGADQLSSTYVPMNWISGVASGGFYAFRTLKIPRQQIVIREFTGRLRSRDMDAVANGAALAVAKLAGQELPPLETDGWTIDCQLGSPSSSPPAAQPIANSAFAPASQQKQIA